MKIQKIISPGEKIPYYYGVSFHRYETNSIICYPIPLNIIIGFARNVFYRYLKTFRPTVFDDLIYKKELIISTKIQAYYMSIAEMNLQREYQRGFDDGYKKRYEDALAAMELKRKKSPEAERIGSKTW